MNPATQLKKGRDSRGSATMTTTGGDNTEMPLREQRGESRVESRVLAPHLGNAHKHVREPAFAGTHDNATRPVRWRGLRGGRVMASKKSLQPVNLGAYTFSVAETAVTGRGNPICLWRTTAHWRYFFVCALSRFQWSGLGRAAFGLAGSHGRRFSTPADVPGHPHVEMGRRDLKSVRGGRTMRHISARPEQTQSPIEIIRAALRDAATAPTVFDALDVTGDALRRLAEIAREEVRHA